MGDFNLDLLKFESRPRVNEFINTFYSNNFFPCIDRPTRIKVNSLTDFTATLIDNIFTNDVEMEIKSGVFFTDLSDHFPIFTFTKSTSPNDSAAHSQFTQRRQLTPDNIQGFKNALSIVDWDFVLNDNDPETSYNKFNDKLIDLFNIHCPMIQTKLSKRKTPRKPWVTKGLVKSIQTKDKLYKKIH